MGRKVRPDWSKLAMSVKRGNACPSCGVTIYTATELRKHYDAGHYDAEVEDPMTHVEFARLLANTFAENQRAMSLIESIPAQIKLLTENAQSALRIVQDRLQTLNDEFYATVAAEAAKAAQAAEADAKRQIEQKGGAS